LFIIKDTFKCLYAFVHFTVKCIIMDYLKLRNIQHADITHTYKNMKEKLHRTSATIWFNRICGLNHLTPDYIKITTDRHNQQCHYTKKGATTYGINQNHIILFVFYTLMYILCHTSCGFGGLAVSMLASGSRVRGF
jgi:hypothetical protein